MPDQDSSQTRTAFFQVGTEKLTELSLVTFGLYGFYWTWRNWQQISRHEAGIRPLLRTLLSFVFQYGLYRRIAARARLENETPRWLPERLFGLFLVFTLIPLWLLLTNHPWGILLNLLTLLPNMLANQSINAVHEKFLPFYEQNTELSGSNWAAIVTGLIGWLTLLILALASDF